MRGAGDASDVWRDQTCFSFDRLIHRSLKFNVINEIHRTNIARNREGVEMRKPHEKANVILGLTDQRADLESIAKTGMRMSKRVWLRQHQVRPTPSSPPLLPSVSPLLCPLVTPSPALYLQRPLKTKIR